VRAGQESCGLDAAGPDAAISGSWIWAQRWLDLLFLHWRVSASSVRSHLPPGVQVETCEGEAWLSLVLFRLKVRPRWLPFVPGVSSLTEANLRTYVRCGGKTGIYFLSLHANNPWSVRLARLFTPLPYQPARMSYRRAGDVFHFERSGWPWPESRLSLDFRPSGSCRALPGDSVDAWLLERYRAFSWSRCKGLMTAEVDHPRWAVCGAEVLRIDCPGAWWEFAPRHSPNRVHFAERVDALFGPFRPAMLVSA
jgi:uncharacterized protein YqjF (DUF2071 family)